VAALAPAGLLAPLTLLGARDSDAFAAYLRAFLLPTRAPGQIIRGDHLNVHKRADLQALIEQAGCQLVFLPPYSPDYNPIELVFSTIKEARRRSAARTHEALEAAIAAALAPLSIRETRHCFRHCGSLLLNQ
jgi:transposase